MSATLRPGYQRATNSMGYKGVSPLRERLKRVGRGACLQHGKRVYGARA
jgi:hypothetical protein